MTATATATATASRPRLATSHGMQVHDGEPRLHESVCTFIASALVRGDGALIVLRDPAWEEVAYRLRRRGFDLAQLEASSRLVVIGAERLLSHILNIEDATVSPDRFRAWIAATARRLAQRSDTAHVVAVGEAVDVLLEHGNAQGALELEVLWSEATRTHDLSIFCLYERSRFSTPDHPHALHGICDVHDYVVDHEDPSFTDEQSRTVEFLQQQVWALQSELALREAEDGSGHLALLGAAGELLASSLDVGTTVEQVASILLPRFGDCGFVDLLQPSGRCWRVIRPENSKTLRARLDRAWPADGNRHEIQLSALSTGRTVHHPEMDERWLTRIASPERQEALRGFGSLVSVPLRWSGRVQGAITLLFARGRGRFSRTDVLVIEEIALRASAALEIARLHQRLQETLLALREAAHRKEEFLAMLGHELRNPLAPILTAVELLRCRGAAGPECAVIERQARHLVRLVDDLLEASRVNRGRITLDPVWTELAPIVERAMDAMGPLLRQRSHTLTVDVPAQGVLVRADPARLAQILTNLLDNAVKYTDAGGRISVRARLDGATVRIVVEDDGIGIAPDHLDSVFELFAQEGRSLDRASGGLGVGLTLVRSLVALHGGTITAHSAGLGAGSRFEVALPGALPPR